MRLAALLPLAVCACSSSPTGPMDLAGGPMDLSGGPMDLSAVVDGGGGDGGGCVAQVLPTQLYEGPCDAGRCYDVKPPMNGY